jgi:hypothetical protein
LGTLPRQRAEHLQKTGRSTKLSAHPPYFFFFGESTMIIWRPSIFGIC